MILEASPGYGRHLPEVFRRWAENAMRLARNVANEASQLANDRKSRRMVQDLEESGARVTAALQKESNNHEGFEGRTERQHTRDSVLSSCYVAISVPSRSP